MNLILRAIGLTLLLGVVGAKNLVCYYDSSSTLRRGLAKMSTTDLSVAVQFCTHLIYGYAGLHPTSYEIISLNVDLDMWHYREITSLKSKYPDLKVYLSIGGDQDIDPSSPNKYIEFLDKDYEVHQQFITSAMQLLQINGFDGLDLAFQFPRNKPRKVHNQIGMFWKKFKKLFTGDFVVDQEADKHKERYTEFVKNIKEAFSRSKLSLAMTVLPNVNSTWYFDIPKIAPHFDLINLAAFDFLTPERNPEEADYTGPIYSLPDQDRLEHYSIDFQVKYWTNQCPPEKLTLGIPSYGRAWKMTDDSGLTGEPVVKYTDGPAEPGFLTNSSGLLSWPEVCAKLPSKINEHYRGEKAPLRKVTDVEQKYGNYAVRPADDEGRFGMWVSYDDPDFAGVKTQYAKSKSLGGISLFDLSYDDFRGLCTGQKFPMLRSIKYYL